MIEDPPIVRDTRRVRCAISKRFGHDPDRYIDYLVKKASKVRSYSTALSNRSRRKSRGQ